MKIFYYQLLGWTASFAIAVLSVLPGHFRPHILGSGAAEHFAAYFLTAALLALGYNGVSNALRIAGLLCIYSAALEIVQLWIPGRSSKFSDVIASSSGTLAGLLAVSVGLWLVGRFGNPKLSK